MVKKASKQSLKYGGKKAFRCIIEIICGYFGFVSIIPVTKSTIIVKCAGVCYLICSEGLDMVKLCVLAPINMIEITISERLAIIKD